MRRHVQQAKSVLPFTIGVAVIAGAWIFIRLAEWKKIDIYHKIKVDRPLITKLLVVGAKATWNTVRIDGK